MSEPVAISWCRSKHVPGHVNDCLADPLWAEHICKTKENPIQVV